MVDARNHTRAGHGRPDGETSAGIAAVIFDMDGVLTDSEPVNFAALVRLMARYGVRYTEAENDEFIGVTDQEHFTALKARYALAPSVADLCRQWLDLVLDLIPHRTVPMSGVPDVPRALARRGFALALASSATPAVIEARLRALGVRDLFPVVVSGVDVARGKPEPDIFLAAASRLGVAPGDCLVIEDSRNGVLAAKRAGMRCVAVPSPPTQTQSFAEADVKLTALPDLLALPGVR